jgi:hypothetical protein
MSFELRSGAEARWTNGPGLLAVGCVNGGRKRELPGTWSASVEWLVRRLAPVRSVIPLAPHATALRRRSGSLFAMPRAERWADLVGQELERFCA